MRSNAVKVMMGLFVAVVFGLAGCGGGGGTTVSATPTVSGTASEGALITGKTVKLKDANGKSAVDGTTNATTGIYSIDVTGLTAPFLVTVTGSNGTYVSLAQTAGTANINPITTTVVALASGNSDVTALFTSLTPAQLTAINTNYTAKSALVTTSLQAALPSGIKAENYFTGTITAGTGMDAVFDTYQIAVNPTAGITVKTKDASATTVLTIPAATVAANTTQALPTITPPTTPTPTPTTYSNSSLSGVWFTSQLGTNGDPLYLVSNGAGTFTDISAFNLSTPAGTYTVNADGTYSMPFGFATLTGSLTSSTAGIVTYSGFNGTINKVADLSKCQGSYSGTIIGGSSSNSTYTIGFSVDSTGNIGSFTSNIPGATTITNSKFFSLPDGTAIFMIRTNATGQEYKQIKGTGTLSNGNFTGSLSLDSNAGNGTVTLTKL